VCTWRQAERVLAGFPDGRADEGPSAGDPSLAGLRLAAREGWAAPDDGDASEPPELTTRPNTPAEATRTAAESATQKAHAESLDAEVTGDKNPSNDSRKPGRGEGDTGKGEA
jgi:NADH-quinone oxidoreductase subunit E